MQYCKVAIASFRRFNNYTPIYIIYDGQDTSLEEFRKKMPRVTVVPWSSSFKTEILTSKHSSGWKQTALGALLRLDIPLVIDKVQLPIKYYLYTDCDVLFFKDPIPKLLEKKPMYFCAASEFKKKRSDHFNSGVLWCNYAKMLRSYHSGFAKYVLKSPMLLTGGGGGGGFDQSVLNHFYRQEREFLKPEFNWKPYWGLSPSIYILHFHGPKPDHPFFGELMTQQRIIGNVPKGYQALLGPHSIKVPFYVHFIKKYRKVEESI